MTDETPCGHPPWKAKRKIRATEDTDTWGTAQTFECRQCGTLWAE